MPGCFAFGTGLQEAFDSAQDALVGYLEVELDRGEVIPHPSDYETAKAEEDLREIGYTATDATLYLLVPADPQPEKPVEVNLSMSPRILALIDAQSKAEGMTRSGFLAVAAKVYAQSLANG